MRAFGTAMIEGKMDPAFLPVRNARASVPAGHGGTANSEEQRGVSFNWLLYVVVSENLPQYDVNKQNYI